MNPSTHWWYLSVLFTFSGVLALGAGLYAEREGWSSGVWHLIVGCSLLACAVISLIVGVMT